jgi:hypothetical protein
MYEDRSHGGAVCAIVMAAVDRDGDTVGITLTVSEAGVRNGTARPGGRSRRKHRRQSGCTLLRVTLNAS